MYRILLRLVTGYLWRLIIARINKLILTLGHATITLSSVTFVDTDENSGTEPPFPGNVIMVRFRYND